MDTACRADVPVDLGDLAQRGYRFALSLTHNVEHAEELTQDAWFSVLKANGPWRRAYLFTTIRNRFIDQCRRDRRKNAWMAQQVAGNGETNGDDTWADDESIAATNGSIKSALQDLRPEERGVLFLSAVEDFSARQIAELLDMPRGTVLSLLHRAKAKVRNYVSKESDEKS